MPDATSDPEDELRLVIQQVARAIRSTRSDDGLSNPQLAALVQLHIHGPQTPSALAALERVTPPSMNRTVNALEKSGLVRRVRSDDDARKVVVHLTTSGEHLLLETRRLRTEWLSRRLAALDPAERAHLLAATPVLQKLVAR